MVARLALLLVLATALVVCAELVLPPAELKEVWIEEPYTIQPIINKATNYYVTVEIDARISENFVVGIHPLREWGWESKCWLWLVPPERRKSTICEIEGLHKAVGIPLWKGTSYWIQSVDVYGLAEVCIQVLTTPTIKDIRLDFINSDTVRISTYINAPASNNIIRLTLFRDGQYIYSIAKRVVLRHSAIPTWSPCIDLRVDFGPYMLGGGRYKAVVELEAEGNVARKEGHLK
jgi:hypothetical protein